MDVVAVEVKKTRRRAAYGEHSGTRYPLHDPSAVHAGHQHALVVRTGDEYYALPLPTVEGVCG